MHTLAPLRQRPHTGPCVGALPRRNRSRYLLGPNPPTGERRLRGQQNHHPPDRPVVGIFRLAPSRGRRIGGSAVALQRRPACPLPRPANAEEPGPDAGHPVTHRCGAGHRLRGKRCESNLSLSGRAETKHDSAPLRCVGTWQHSRESQPHSGRLSAHTTAEL